MVTDRNTKLTAFLLGLAGILMSVAAVAEDRILITTEFPDEFTCELCVIEQAAGGSGGDSFISGGPELNEPQQIVFGPDDNLYVLDEQENATKGGGGVGDEAYAVLRYDGSSGSFIDAFVAAGANGLNEAKNMIFGPDGHLYISVNEIPGNDQDFCDEEEGGGAVWRFNGTTGAFMDVFVANGAGNTGGGGDDDDDAERVCEAQALAFMPGGDLLVGNSNDDIGNEHNILRFDGTTGAYVETFVATNDNSLHDPQWMVYGPDGNLYVSRNDDSNGGNESSVLRYNGTTGAFIDTFVDPSSGGIDEPMGLGFGFDGNLYVVEGDEPGGIYRYNGSTGAFMDIFVPEENSNMADSRSLLFFMRIAEIPTLNPWAMALLALALVGLAGFVLVRRKRASQT